MTYKILSEDGTAFFLLRLEEEMLSSFEWWIAGERHLRIEYDHWQTQGGLALPTTLRIAAPQLSVTAEVTLDHWRQRDDFTAADFEVY